MMRNSLVEVVGGWTIGHGGGKGRNKWAKSECEEEGEIDLEDEGVCNLTETLIRLIFGEPLSAPEARKRTRGSPGQGVWRR